MQEYLKRKNLQKIVEKIFKVLEKNHTCVLAIDGNSASGKSTLANELSQFFDTRIIHLDDFYLPRDVKDLNTSFDGNIDLQRFKEEIIDKLFDDSLTYRAFSCKEQKIVSSSNLSKKELTIVEGSYSLNPYFGKYYDLSIFIKISEETQLKRLKERNKDNYLDFINKRVVLENRYNSHYGIDKNAMLVIDNDN